VADGSCSCFTTAFRRLQPAAVSRESNFSSKHAEYFLLFDIPSHSLSAFGIQYRLYSWSYSSSGVPVLRMSPADTQPSTCVPPKASTFPLKSGFAFRSDSCNALPGTRCSGFGVWLGYLQAFGRVTYWESKAFFIFFQPSGSSRLTHRAENIRRRTGKKLYQESSSFILIPRTKKY